jgi:hypothetical protein
MKQYVPKKPVKRVWVRADAVSGYVSELDVYTGKVPGEREFGLGGNVVKRLTRHITGHHHTVYCDNFFTITPLFKDLLSDKVYACGTYNYTRKCYPKDLKPIAKSGLKQRGEYRYRQQGNLLVSLWQDTKTVSVLSTNQSPSEVAVRRRQDGARIEVPCPLAIKIYIFMGGVDRNDQLRGYYSVRTKSRKSYKYKYIFWFLFDVAIVNSFILYGMSPATGRKKTMKEFRVELAHQLIGSYNSRRYGGRPHANSTSRPKRMKVPHYPVKSSRGRCKACYKEGRMSTTTWWCNECQLRLCHTGDSKHHLSKGLYDL